MNRVNIELVQSQPEYAELWDKWRREPDSLRHNPLVLTDIANLRQRMQACCSDLSNLSVAKEFQFFVRWNDQLVGVVNLNNVNLMMMTAELGYGIGQEFQGKGLGTEAIRCFVDKVFNETKLRKLYAFVADANIASRRLLERVGFAQEGHCREHFIVNGSATNEVLYGVLRTEWKRSSEFTKPKSITQPTLETDRLILEPYQITDAEDVFAYASRPEVTKFLLWEPHRTIDDSKKFLQWVRSATSYTTGQLFFVFAMRLKESGKVIGSVDFKNPQPWIGQIDYAMHVDHWGKGLMPEAASALRDWAFSAFDDLVRLQSYCDPANIGSKRVMEKVGMTFEGIRKKSFKSKDRIVDLAHYALVREI